MTLRTRAVLAAVIATAAVTAISPGALAADAQGRFSSKGAGLARCSDFLDAYAADDEKLLLYAGYVHGAISTANAMMPDTFDVLPWQDNELMLKSLAFYCSKRRTERFARVVLSMVQSLRDARLTTHSPLRPLPEFAGGGRLYEETIRRAQRALGDRGLLDGEPSGDYDAAAAAAVERFQAAQGLEVTGRPDQETLRRLFFEE